MLSADPDESQPESPDRKSLGRMHDFLATEDGVTKLNHILDKRFNRAEKLKAAIASAAKPVQHTGDGQIPETPNTFRRASPRDIPETPKCVYKAQSSFDDVDGRSDWTGELCKVPQIGDQIIMPGSMLDRYEWDGELDDLCERSPVASRNLFRVPPTGDDNNISTEQADAFGYRGSQATLSYTESAVTSSQLDGFELDVGDEDLSESSPPAPISKKSGPASLKRASDPRRNSYPPYSAAVAESEAGLAEMESSSTRLTPAASTWRMKLKRRVEKTVPKNLKGSGSLPFLQSSARYAQYVPDSRMRTQVSFTGPQSTAFMFHFKLELESNPYVKALQAHREEIQRNYTDISIIKEDSLASRLATQRHDALASMSSRAEAEEPPNDKYLSPCGHEPCRENCEAELEIVHTPKQQYPRLYRTPRSSSIGAGEALHSTRSYMSHPSARELADNRSHIDY